jgi:hypothetical protein
MSIQHTWVLKSYGVRCKYCEMDKTWGGAKDPCNPSGMTSGERQRYYYRQKVLKRGQDGLGR